MRAAAQLRAPAARTGVRATEVHVHAPDGKPLAATLFEPTSGSAERGVVIASATGVSRGLYTLFARFLAARGCAVVTFDFRGVGDSLRGPPACSDATILDWGRLDYPAVLDWMSAEVPGRPLHLVGHSIGGQLIGMLHGLDRVTSVCTVASQNAWYRRYDWRRCLKYGLLWHLAVPAAAAALGRFPARRLGLGSDLPAGVARDWARFATHPDYLVDRRGRPLRLGFDTLRAPVLAYSFADDHRAPAPLVEVLHAHYRRAPVTYRHLAPRTLGVPSVGHMGFFSPYLKRALWHDTLQWLVHPEITWAP